VGEADKSRRQRRTGIESVGRNTADTTPDDQTDKAPRAVAAF
jgi:hypothetical protein